MSGINTTEAGLLTRTDMFFEGRRPAKTLPKTGRRRVEERLMAVDAQAEIPGVAIPVKGLALKPATILHKIFCQ